MPFMFLAMYSCWWDAVLKPKNEIPAVIVLLPENEAPELAMTDSRSVTEYQG